MSYPPPPGASNSSLPPRPPPSKSSGFKPAFSSAPAHTPSPSATASPYAPPSYSSAPSYSNAPSYPGASAPQYGASYSAYPQPAAAAVSGAGYGPQASRPYQNYQQPAYGQQGYYGPTPDAGSYAATPQIRNPFPTPGQPQHNSDYDPDMAAQIAQWQSAYVKDPKDATIPVAAGARPGTTTAAYPAEPSSKPVDPNPQNPEKKKTVVRSGGGQKWTDDTLVEWDPAHLRLFVGNLAGETTDESLFKAFSRWKSLQKARVIRDKVTSKSKGFGFVSFSDPDEFFSAAKEMNGKYIQSHPVVVRKSTTEIKYVAPRRDRGRGSLPIIASSCTVTDQLHRHRPTTVKDKHHGGKWNKNKNKNKNRGGSGGGAGGGGAGGQGGSYEPSLGPQGAGVTKPGQKTKNGLKLLG